MAERSMRKIDTLLSANNGSAAELLLLKGLTAHYAYNLDQQVYFDVAVDSLQKARKALPADCRPLWFLGNHYTKGAEAEKGVPFLKQATQQCGDKLPLEFWEDYAYAALIAAMPATGKYALDQVRRRNSGALTAKVKSVEEGVTRRLVAPLPGKEYTAEDVWQFGQNEGVVRFVNSMYGFMINIPGNWNTAPLGVRNGSSGIGLRLPMQGKWPPPLEVVVYVSPVSPETVPAKVLRGFLAKAGRKSFEPIAGPGVPVGEKFLWLDSRQKKGSRVLAGILRRQQPAYPGLVLESPHNIPQQKADQQSPLYYAPVEQLTRVPGELDYIIMIEGAPAAFDMGRADLEFLLRHVVIE